MAFLSFAVIQFRKLCDFIYSSFIFYRATVHKVATPFLQLFKKIYARKSYLPGLVHAQDQIQKLPQIDVFFLPWCNKN